MINNDIKQNRKYDTMDIIEFGNLMNFFIFVKYKSFAEYKAISCFKKSYLHIASVYFQSFRKRLLRPNLDNAHVGFVHEK